jgi:tRNA pseudouridine38-40 synthase
MFQPCGLERMPRFKLILEYHGGPFVGWQRQDNGPSVQAILENALARLGETGRFVQGAGRTDAGVHARGQVAHVDLSRDWDPGRLSEALNHHVKPAPVAVLSARLVDEDFHARFSAIQRTYLYRIANRRSPLAIEAGLLWRVTQPLDITAMQRAASALIGTHDFTTFRASQCQAKSPVKSIDHISVWRATEQEIRIHVVARSFLHNQVRSIVGSLARVGAGKWPVIQMAQALNARDRTACGPVAPPEGLYLESVAYEASECHVHRADSPRFVVDDPVDAGQRKRRDIKTKRH